MAENRLFQMVYLLLKKRNMTAPELAKHFEVSVRTIYRDIDILSAAGIPVFTMQGKGGGIFIQENFVLNKSLISEQEQKQILFALHSLNVVDEENTSALLSKLGGVFQKQNVSWIEVDFSEWTQKSEDAFQILKSAIFQNVMVSFSYVSRNGQHNQRTVEPLKLVFKSRAWYLYAFCSLRQDYRLFKLNRIKELQISLQHFVRPAPEKVFDHMELYTDSIVELSLVFCKKLDYHVYEYFDKFEEREDGSFLVHISLPDNESLYSFLLSFGDSVEVLSPSDVREKMKKKISNMKRIY